LDILNVGPKEECYCEVGVGRQKMRNQ